MIVRECPSCGTENKPQARFCRVCGTPLPTGNGRTCPQCGCALRDGARFCKRCGMPVGADDQRLCGHCGRPVKDTSRFCPFCGERLAAPEPQEEGARCPNCGALARAGARFCSNCSHELSGTSVPEPPQPPNGFGTGDLLPTTVLAERYVILEKIAQGGMGAVYKAQDKRLQGKVVAVKEMSESAIQPSERDQVIACFQREAELLARLRHPNLARVTDRFQRGERHYTVMEYVEGETLHEVLKTRKEPFPEERVLIWADQLCDVLAFLHRQDPKIIYRDMKPGNIMLREGSDVVKLIDFGIARFYKPGRRRDTIEFGTDGYAPPEQYGKAQTDERSDVYALGATLHQLLSLRDPVSKPFHFPPLHRLNPNVSQRVASVIDKAVEPSKSQRYPDMDEMRAALLEGVSLDSPLLPTAAGHAASSGDDEKTLVVGDLTIAPASVDFGDVVLDEAPPSQSVSITIPVGERVQLSTDAPWLEVRPRSAKAAAAGGGSSTTSIEAKLTVTPGALEPGRRRLKGGALRRWAGWHTRFLVPAPKQQQGRLAIEVSGGTRHHIPVSLTVAPQAWRVTLGWIVTVVAMLIEVTTTLALAALGLLALLLW